MIISHPISFGDTPEVLFAKGSYKASQPTKFFLNYVQSSSSRELTIKNEGINVTINTDEAVNEKSNMVVSIKTKIAAFTLIAASLMIIAGFVFAVFLGNAALGGLLPLGLFIWAIIGYSQERKPAQ